MSAGTCCGRTRQVVVLGDDAAALVRCPVCAEGEWRLAGRVVSRAEALAALGDAYREAPRRARAARDRAATARAARTAARVATAAAASATTAGAREETGALARRAELGRMLQGWTVLTA